MHPAMYDDPAVKLRCSERQPVSVKPRCRCCDSRSGDGNKLHGSVKPDAVVSADLIKPSWDDDSCEKLVFVGCRFQAEVPQWTGVVYERDSKWLGTQVWSVKDDSEPTTETDLVGRGRRGKCSCNVQGSVHCVRVHIAANRMKVKLELGSTFYHWGFDKMGEEVSHRWTADEEKRFKDAMRLKIPSQNKSFWNNPSIYFQRKTRKDMVSYCLNVYLIQLRSYQNRVTPETVDSDNEEVEFGSFGDGFGRKSYQASIYGFHGVFREHAML